MLEQVRESTKVPRSIAIDEGKEEIATEEDRRELLRRNLGLSGTVHTFESFKPVKGTGRALTAMREMANGNHLPLLLLCGAIGNGKTHLCEALCIALYRKGVFCPVTLWSELRRELLRRMHRARPDEKDYDEFFEDFRKRRHVIIDDIGMGSRGTEWEMCELEDIVNYRYRERLFTVLTTNRTLEELPERVVSRFFDPAVGEVVINEGKDYRLRREVRRKGIGGKGN